MDTGMIYYEAQANPVIYQRCGIKRRHDVNYKLHLNQQQLSVNIPGQKRSKVYKVNPKSIEEGRQLLRKAIKQLDRLLGI